MAMVLVKVFLDALMIADFFTSEPLMLIEPVLALEFSPIAIVLVKVFLDALIMADFSILEPSAKAELERATKTTAANNVFMCVSSKVWVSKFKVRD